jgi:hypothetical protein
MTGLSPVVRSKTFPNLKCLIFQRKNSTGHDDEPEAASPRNSKSGRPGPRRTTRSTWRLGSRRAGLSLGTIQNPGPPPTHSAPGPAPPNLIRRDAPNPESRGRRTCVLFLRKERDSGEWRSRRRDKGIAPAARDGATPLAGIQIKLGAKD